ncbi:MAG: 6-phosphogluconolactonase [Clostridia bacterium]|nr:6-phosphogluconolactonase [Clostridia bacterium]
MKISISTTAVEMGRLAAIDVARRLNQAIAERGYARLLLSTGASQFEMFESLIEQDVDWSKVDMFHLDEYINLPITHPASFRKYLTERFTTRVPLRNVYFVEAEGDLDAMLAKLNAEITAAPIDVGLIGIGENGHIAFNDPPADFKTLDPYIVVNLNDTCKNQQVREGWFATPADVPAQAVSMSVHQIMMCRSVISVVPRAVKADAIAKTFANAVCNEVPATMLKMHPDWTLYLEDLSAAKLDRAAWAEYMI